MARRDDDFAQSDPRLRRPPKRQKAAVIDARVSDGAVRDVSDAIQRHPVRAAAVLRSWMNERR